MRHRLVTVYCLACLLGLMFGSPNRLEAKVVREVTFSYVTQPTTSLPRGLKAVAVLDVRTKSDADRKWSKIAGNMISGLLSRAARKGDSDLKIADRRNLAKIMAERDLATTGLVEGKRATEAAKLLGIQGLIAGSITVKVEKHRGTGQTFSGINIRGLRQGRRDAVRVKKVGKVTRHITVQCRFSLVDATDGKIIIEHVSRPLSRTDKTKPRRFFGSSKTEAEMTPRDQIVADAIEREARTFIGLFFPVERKVSIAVRASGNDDCEDGVKLLAVGDYDEAVRMFKRAIADDDDGDKYASFAMGVACEAKGELDEAVKHYRLALREKVDGAVEAISRVRARMKAAVAGGRGQSSQKNP